MLWLVLGHVIGNLVVMPNCTKTAEYCIHGTLEEYHLLGAEVGGGYR